MLDDRSSPCHAYAVRRQLRATETLAELPFIGDQVGLLKPRPGRPQWPVGICCVRTIQISCKSIQRVRPVGPPVNTRCGARWGAQTGAAASERRDRWTNERQDTGPLAFRSDAHESWRRRLSSARFNFLVMLCSPSTALARCDAAWRNGGNPGLTVGP